MSSALSSRTAHAERALRAVGSLGLVLGAWLLLAGPLRSADRAGQFLDELRRRGWHDVALEYLETADQDPLASAEFLDRVDYERAMTLVTIAGTSIRQSERDDLYGQAIVQFKAYANDHQESPFYFEALSQSGDLLADQARGALAKANRLPETATAQREALRDKARDTFDAASEVVAQLLEACRRKLQSLPKGALAHQDPRTPLTRQQLTAKQAEARFLAANLLFEKAETFPSATPQYNETLDAASKSFAKLYKDYKDKLVGFYGRLYEGRCYQASGKNQEALDCYAELIDQPIGNPDFRRLVSRAYRHSAECHMAAGNVEEAIEQCSEWLHEASGKELKQPQWLAVAYRLAEALRLKADVAAGSEANRLRSEARQLFRDVSRESGEFQIAAKAALASGNVGATAPTVVKTFAEAYAAGQEALERMNSTRLAAKLAADNNPESVADLERQAVHNQSEAQRLLQTALRLADAETNIDDLLAARYYLCWIFWEKQLFHEAAVMGEFLARRYPDHGYAAGAAKVALAALEKLYHDATQSGDGGDYEAAHLAALAEFAAKRWPRSAEASAAVSLLIQIALRDDRLDEAESLLERLPDGNRAAAELSLGSSLWTRYLQRLADRAADNTKQTAKLKQRIEELLSSGYETLSMAEPTTVQQAIGVLYYAQLLLAQGDFERAVEVLENPAVGPLAIAEGRSIAVQPAFVQEAYKAALRAYISLDPPRREKAEQMMAALEELIGSDGRSPELLTRMYLSLGLQLQRQISELSESGKLSQAQSVAAAFEDLLERITSRGGAKDWKIRNWVAQTNLQLGEGLQGEAALRYLQQAEQVYQAMLSDAEKNRNEAPSEIAVLGMKKRLGDCLRAQHKYDAAFDQYVGVLKEKPNMLELQRTVALMLQQWGNDKQKSDKLESAIHGALPQENRKNLVWGWLRLARIANGAKQKAASGADGNQPDPLRAEKYENLFFEAHYNVAKTRLLSAQLASGAERAKQLNSARKNIESMQRLYPNLGGSSWKQQFNELLKQIDAQE